MATDKSSAEFDFRRNPEATSPIYLQLSEAISDAIRAGRIPIGARLPSERLYALKLGVSRTTVTNAYQELMATGMVRGYVGRGTIVVADHPGSAPAGAISWLRLTARAGKPFQTGHAAEVSDHITFCNGQLHPSLIPHAALAASMTKAMDNPDALSKSAPILGLPALREALVDSLKANAMRVTSDEILITSGAQQGLDVIARTLISPRDVVLCESYTWHGACRAFRDAGAEVVGVAMDHEGIDPAALEEAVVRVRPKFIYLIPSFQCPTGRSMGLERRRRVMEICTRLRVPIVESHVLGDTAFGDALPTLKSLDTAGIVIHQGSASKSISSALRLGWLVAPPAAIELLAPAKASLDLSTPALTQAALASFLQNGGYARHLVQFRAKLRVRRDAMVAALAVSCPDLRFAMPQGGLYLWVRLPKPLTSHAFVAAALAEGVSIKGGEAFLTETGTSSYVRLCYAAPALNEISPGIKRLGNALGVLLQRSENSVDPIAALAAV
jgi:GntR family transcriptional regulator/MocR family aminotransferase